ncbi:COG1051 ADP-ribose pyrophosphatase [Burkholderiales bacterium]|jgi:ADP-ribose pyrophosphatase YjhB (NUDIX family)
MNFCSGCGHAVRREVPADDNRLRAVCSHCKTVHYENPKMVLGTIPTHEGQVLLCRRAIEPRHGFWTLPAGFMELGESTADGAIRETIEEAGADIELGRLFAVFDIPHVDQVHLFYLAAMRSTKLDPGPETLEAALFDESDIPWNDLAFRSVRMALEHFFEDRRLGLERVHSGSITRPPTPYA